MRLAVRLAAAVLAPLLCLGAGPAPEPVAAGEQTQTAQIELLRTPDLDDNAISATKEILWLAKDTSCRGKFGAKNIGAFGMLYGNDKGPVAIPAGKVAYLWMVGDAPVTSGSVVLQWYVGARRRCENAAQFVPEAGHSYDVQQRTSSTSCRLLVIDRATHLPPPTYQAFSPKVFCQSKKAGQDNFD
ncbi:MAG TPA: hypothetical protein VGL66_11975 [Caulobacteraceae bacterium]|jgi:hypothetical protein